MKDQYWLLRGAHSAREEGMCSMEWVAFIAGEEHTDHPLCVDPNLAWYCVGVNDALEDEDRQRLRPYLARCIGTADDDMTDARRDLMLEVSWWIRSQRAACPRFAPFIEQVGVEGALRLLEAMLPTEIIRVPALPDVAAEPTECTGAPGW